MRYDPDSQTYFETTMAQLIAQGHTPGVAATVARLLARTQADCRTWSNVTAS